MLLMTADDVVIMMTMTMMRMMTRPTRRMTMMSMRVTITSRMMLMMKQFLWPQRRCSACCIVTHPKPSTLNPKPSNGTAQPAAL